MRDEEVSSETQRCTCECLWLQITDTVWLEWMAVRYKCIIQHAANTGVCVTVCLCVGNLMVVALADMAGLQKVASFTLNNLFQPGDTIHTTFVEDTANSGVPLYRLSSPKPFRVSCMHVLMCNKPTQQQMACSSFTALMHRLDGNAKCLLSRWLCPFSLQTGPVCLRTHASLCQALQS